MPGYNPRDNSHAREGGNEFLDEMLEDMSEDVTEKKEASSRRKRSSGEYLRKIEQLREEKMLRDHLADYDWDD